MQKINMRKFSKFSIAVISVMLFAFVVISIFGINDFYAMRNSTKQYILCEKAAQKLQNGSDTLTEQVRLYVITGHTEYMNNYFKEADVTKSRESAVEELKKNFDNTEIISNLETALSDSHLLMERECYAMRLTAESLNTDCDTLPEEVANVRLSDKDLALSPEEMREEARLMVCDDVYQQFKNKITSHVGDCMDGLINQTEIRQNKALAFFRRLYAIQGIGILLIIIFVLSDNIVMQKMIINPIVSCNKKIEQDEPMPIIGAAELQSLEETYNRIFEENRESQRRIKYEAEHDSLTDLLNKGSFNRIIGSKINNDQAFALLVADIDKFKVINDKNGHAVGDKVIKFVADQIRQTFSEGDLVFRVGGDEFAVIIDGISEESKQTLENKFIEIRKKLKRLFNNLSSVTISAGVAFNNGYVTGDDLFKNADKALYAAKENGKDSICFFGC